MSDYKHLDGTADVLPVGLQPTPFGEVWQALQQVAASVWDVDPSVYRAGMAWLWYAVNHPDDLASDSLRALLVAALISEQAPMVKDWQTNAELVEYLRIWRAYSPTYAKLEAIFATFGAQVEVRPISDAESQGVVPVADRRLAFYLRVENFDASRPLTLDEVYQIAVRATPLGSRPVPYFALVGGSDVFAGPASAGLARVLWASGPAEPYTPPTPAYTEITLYLVSGSKKAQSGVTSAYTGNVNSTYCYQLYTDAECTIPWTGYDYSNDYELGTYVDGVWTPRSRQTISSMPATTTGNYDYVFGRILLDNGFLWHVTNFQLEGTTSAINPIVRIYPKAQQHYALYFNYNNLYGNYSLGASRPGYPWPSGSSGNYKAWFESYPVPSFVKFLGSAENEFLQGGDVGAIAIRNNSSNALEVARIGYTNNINIRCAIFTLDSPTLFAWTRADKTNRTMSSGTVCTLFDENGNAIAYDDSYSYKILGVLQSAGANCSGERNVIKYASLLSSNSALAFMQTYGSVTAAKIWYIKEQRNIVVNFGDPVTIPDGFTVDSVKCTKLFVKSSEISYSGHVIYFEYTGANVYSDDTDLALFGVGVNPCIEMFGFSNASTFTGFRLSVDFSRSGYATAVSASKLNTDGYFVKGEATLSSSHTTSTYVGHMQANPMMFRLYINSAVKAYHFKVPQSVWQYQNGVFSWLGNDTDTTDLAYWYKSAPDICIYLRKI